MTDGCYDIHNTWGKYDEDVLKVLVTDFDDHTISVRPVGGEDGLQVEYGPENKYLTREGAGDWAYLKSILHVGAQLNLVRIRRREDVLMPELIIYEPDILINATTIASCFETYAESPFVSLINKIKRTEPSIPIHLGNLAGQFLDETVHGEAKSFAESFLEFFRANALNMVACEDIADEQKVRDMYANAQKQKQNIEKLIGEELPEQIGDYDNAGVTLEPTFISEVLGLQGRLDFLYEHGDRTVIIEQKSGKGGFVPFTTPDYDPERPVMQEKHEVQLLLYRALFVYEFSKYASQMEHIFLLYSKYSKGLVEMPQKPALMLRAIRMRNLLAWCEESFAEGGMSVLKTMTPEKLNMKKISGKLWDMYVRPQLSDLLAPIHLASSLEQAYVLRFMTFLAKEQMMARRGTRTPDNYGFSSIWNNTLEEKRNLGCIYEGLHLEDVIMKGKAVESVVFSFTKEDVADTSNFRPGDAVLLYSYPQGDSPYACKQMVTRATVVDITQKGVTLRLRFLQTDSNVFKHTLGRENAADGSGMLYAVEHDSPDSASSALYSGLYSLLSTTKDRRDLILSQRMPRVDETILPNSDYRAFNDLVTHAKQARELFLVIGPPGTGKTSYGLLYQLREELSEPNSNVLLLSYTNRAVDEICSKLVEDGIDFIRIGAELSCLPEYRKYLIANRLAECRKGVEVSEVIRRTRVFCATTSSMNSNLSLFKVKSFDLVIVDEASQILEPHLVGLLSFTNGEQPAIGRMVLIGDHKQLPAVVQQTPEESAVTDPQLLEIGLRDCRLSFFERMLTRFRLPDGGYDPHYVFMLQRQGRMHHDIADFPSRSFYNGLLDVVPLPHQTQPSDSSRVAFYDILPQKTTPSDMVNNAEAEAIAAKVYEIYCANRDDFNVEKTVGVIVPYRNQTATIRRAIDAFGVPELHDICIDTVERYQGSQRDYILYGFTVQKPYQLDFLMSSSFVEDGVIIDRKLNVAMTRARLNLLLFGNAGLLTASPVFSSLIEYCKRINAFTPCCSGKD